MADVHSCLHSWLHSWPCHRRAGPGGLVGRPGALERSVGWSGVMASSLQRGRVTRGFGVEGQVWRAEALLALWLSLALVSSVFT